MRVFGEEKYKKHSGEAVGIINVCSVYTTPCIIGITPRTLLTDILCYVILCINNGKGLFFVNVDIMIIVVVVTIYSKGQMVWSMPVQNGFAKRFQIPPVSK